MATSPLQKAEKRRELRTAEYNLSTWHVRLAQLDAEVQEAQAVEGECYAVMRQAETRVWLAMQQPGASPPGAGDFRLPGQDAGDPGAPWVVEQAKAAHEAASKEVQRAGLIRQRWENERHACVVQISGLTQLVSRLSGEVAAMEPPGYALTAGSR